MENFYQREFGNIDRSLFHHELIRILVEFKLSHLGDTWENFLQRNGFVPLVQDKVREEIPHIIEVSLEFILENVSDSEPVSSSRHDSTIETPIQPHDTNIMRVFGHGRDSIKPMLAWVTRSSTKRDKSVIWV